MLRAAENLLTGRTLLICDPQHEEYKARGDMGDRIQIGNQLNDAILNN